MRARPAAERVEFRVEDTGPGISAGRLAHMREPFHESSAPGTHRFDGVGLGLAVLGLTSQSLGYLFISISLPRLPAVVTSLILLVQPVITVGLSMVLLGERPSPAQLAGVALVIGGIAVATVPIARVRDAIRAGREQPAPVVD